MEIQEKKISKKIIHLLFLVIIFSFAFFTLHLSEANAASLYFSPSSGSYNVGQTITVGVYVNSSDKTMNAASGIISFPADKLQVASISKSGSIINLWVQEPSFSNTSGTVNFEGVVLNPGFTGQAGKIIDINFRAKNEGVSPVTFYSGFVLANDGLGTDILTNSGSASFNLGGGTSSTVKTKDISVSGVPSAPNISSPTHPDSDRWYANDIAEFEWNIPNGTTGTRLLIGKRAKSLPIVTYIPPISSKIVDDLDDGVWYFHARLRNDKGWGATSHFKLQVDTTPPESQSIRFHDDKETDNPRPVITIEHSDKMSGVAGHCDIKIDDGEWFRSNYETDIENPDNDHTFRLPLQKPGRHTILVKTFDKAGNSVTRSEEFVIDPLWPPKITLYPKELKKGDELLIKGTTYPNSKVTIHIQKQKEEKNQSYFVNSDNDGKFILNNGEKLKRGVYDMWAEVTDERGAVSEPTEKVNITVKSSASFLGDKQLISILILIVLLVIAWYVYSTFILIRKKLKKEINEAQSALHKAFGLLREEMQEHVTVLEKAKRKRILTKEEEKTIKRFKKNLEDAEKFIKKEIDDIEKELK